MGFESLPTELLGVIIHHYVHVSDRKGNTSKSHKHVFLARLICWQWNKLATPYLYDTLSLTKNTIARWHSMLDNEEIKSHVRIVVISAAQVSIPSIRSTVGWMGPEEPLIHIPFRDAIGRIKELRGLRHVKVCFSDRCRVPDGGSSDIFDMIDGVTIRRKTLTAVFKAVGQRARENPGFQSVHSLTINNLQNMAIPELTQSDIFRSVMGDIRHLDLRVANSPANDDKETWRFEPHLCEWLVPCADRLTELSLQFNRRWGWLPRGFSDAIRHVDFPNLRILNLEHYVISRHDQLNWVLAMPSLATLRLDRCPIVTHIYAMPDDMNWQAIQPGDWKRLLFTPSDTRDIGLKIYLFYGTWEDIFHKMHTRLPSLANLYFSRSCDVLSQGPNSAILDTSRYITIGRRPGPILPCQSWVLPGLDSRTVRFSISGPVSRDIDGAINGKLSMEEKNNQHDLQALRGLLESIRTRQWR